jgi:prephenate dehydrogenase
MKITVVGLGLIGASMARALSRGAEVAGIDRDGAVVRRALDDGVISDGSTDVRMCAGSDVVVLALPVGAIVETALEVIPCMDEDAVLTDTGSTKARIVSEMDRVFGGFVGAHPIAGKENPGYASSDAALFKGAVTIVTPSPRTEKHRIEVVKGLWEDCGATTKLMDPVSHDRLMAKISHIPHLLSYATMGLARDLHIHRRLLGAGFRDFTRIAASDPIMWRDIFLDNKDNILPLIDEYMEELRALRTLIERDGASELREKLADYARIRRALYDGSR